MLKRNIKKSEKMTLILGIKYKDGIVLIGDTKITQGSSYYYDNKIEAPVSGIKVAVGSAGLTALSKDFNRKVNDLVTQRISEYRFANIKELVGTGVNIEDVESGKINVRLTYIYNENKFLDDCAFLTKQVAELGKLYQQNPIESIVGINVSSPLLYQIDCNGLKMEVPHVAIGSGSDHIGSYLKENYYREITLDESILIGTFLIKYVELLGFDSNVGVEKDELPQIFNLDKDTCENYFPPISKKKEVLKEVNARIKKIRKNMILISSTGKKEPSGILSKRKTR
ncbi:MAG: hypothetical protein WC197_07055 [Candidatus Gastranaerophilaceae bacterium]|jgi:20S proteasome alpha/beta subunit